MTMRPLPTGLAVPAGGDVARDVVAAPFETLGAEDAEIAELKRKKLRLKDEISRLQQPHAA